MNYRSINAGEAYVFSPRRVSDRQRTTASSGYAFGDHLISCAACMRVTACTHCESMWRHIDCCETGVSWSIRRNSTCLPGTASPRSSTAAAIADTCSGGRSEQNGTWHAHGASRDRGTDHRPLSEKRTLDVPKVKVGRRGTWCEKGAEIDI